MQIRVGWGPPPFFHSPLCIVLPYLPSVPRGGFFAFFGAEAECIVDLKGRKEWKRGGEGVYTPIKTQKGNKTCPLPNPIPPPTQCAVT